MLLRLAGFPAALFSIGSLVSSYAQADTISTWNSGSGNWSNAAQWTPARVPNNTGNQSYAVTINNGTVALDISPTIDTLTLNSGLTTGYEAPNGQFTTLEARQLAMLDRDAVSVMHELKSNLGPVSCPFLYSRAREVHAGRDAEDGLKLVAASAAYSTRVASNVPS